MIATEESDEELERERAYLGAIEEQFILLRGAPLLLSAADWRLARGWFTEGIPLELVLAALRDVFARLRPQGEARAPKSLRYCRRAVEAEWQSLREAAGPSSRAPVLPMSADRLGRLVAALPDALPDRAAWQARLRACEGEVDQVEARLGRLEVELLDALETELDPSEVAAITGQAERTATRVEGRLSPADRLELAERLRREAVRRRFGLPILSLFASDGE